MASLPIPSTGLPARGLACRAGLLALLPAEVLAVTVRFDTESLAREQTWWADLIGEAHFLPQLALTVAVAVAVFAGGRLRREVAAALAGGGPARFPWSVVAAQLAAFAAFTLLTHGILVGELRHSPHAGLWAAAWVAAGAATGVLWFAALVPVRAWAALARRFGATLGLAAGVGLVAWAASRSTEGLWTALGDGTFWAVGHSLRAVFPDATASAADRIIGTPAYSVHIAPSCSGYEGLGLVLAFLGCFLWFDRDALRFPRALALLPLGLAVAWLANVGRITALVAIGTWGWPEVARGGFHSQAGWLTFNVIALGLVGLGRCSVFRRETDRADEPAAGRNLAVPYLLPLAAIVGTAMLTGALSDGGFDRLYPARLVVAAAVIWVFRKDYARLGWGWSWAAVGAGLAVFAAWIGLEFLLAPGAESPADAGFDRLPSGWAAVWLVARVLGAVVTVPLAEELAFRGFLLRRLQGEEPDEPMAGRWNWFAVVVSSVLFGILHPGRWVAGTLAGVVYAAAFYRRGRLADAVVAHAVTNAALAAYVLATGQWSLW